MSHRASDEVLTEKRQEERVVEVIDDRMALSDGSGASLEEVMAGTLARRE